MTDFPRTTIAKYCQRGACVLLLAALGGSIGTVVIGKEYTQVQNDSSKHHRIHIVDGDQVTIKTDNFDISVKGTIEFSDDEQRIRSMTPGSSLKLSKHQANRHIVIDIQAQASGQPKARYWINGQQQADNPGTVAKLLAELLPPILKESAINAKNRINTRLTNHGFKDVVEYASTTNNQYASANYLTALLELHRATLAQWQLVEQQLDRFTSDHALTEVLSQLYLQGHRLGIAPSNLFSLFSRLASSHEKAELFAEVNEKIRFTLTDVMTLLGTIESAHYQAEMVESFIKNTPPLSATEVEDLLRQIDNDHYKVETFLAIDGHVDIALLQLRHMLMTLGSDHYRAEVINHAVESEKYGLEQIFQALEFVESDHYKSELLQEMLENSSRDNSRPRDNSRDEQLLLAILAHASTLDSPYNVSHVLTAVMENGLLSPRLVEAIKGRIADLDNDHLQHQLSQQLALHRKVDS